MDEMKIALRTGFMRKVVSKFLSKTIAKKTGYRANVKINNIEIEKKGDRICLHLDLNADMDEKDLLKITRIMEEDEEL